MPIYLDNATTSHPKPEEVYKAVEITLREKGGTPGRGGHKMAFELSKMLYNSRKLIASFFNISTAKNIIFTSNATEALNLALKGLLKAGDHVITSSIDHNAMIRPLAALNKHGITHTNIQCSPYGELNPDDVKNAIKKNTRLIAITHASNIVGTISPIEKIGEIAYENNLFFLVDAAQTAGLIPIDVQQNHIDLLACTGHKSLFGPQGTGFLYASKDITLEPLIYGGTGSASESPMQPDFLPDKYQSGTINMPGIAGLSAGIQFILQKGIKKIREHETTLSKILYDGLGQLKKIKLYGLSDFSKRMPVISFTIEGLDPAHISNILDSKYNIVSRVGLHCAPNAHKTIKTFPMGTVRLSPGFFNTKEEIDYLLNSLSLLI